MEMFDILTKLDILKRELAEEKKISDEQISELKGRIRASDLQGFADTASTANDQEFEMARIRETIVVLNQYKSKLSELGQSCSH